MFFRCVRVHSQISERQGTKRKKEHPAASMIAGCACFPAGWADDNVRRVCGATSDKYALGTCGIRWAYLLAAIGCLDAVILSTLAFILATRHVRLQPDPHYAAASLFKGYVGDSAMVKGSRKSMSIHPVVLMHPQDDTYSPSFLKGLSLDRQHSGHCSHPHSVPRNFQL
ncbi:hypothetical protein NQ317_009718 [Molorchus minor]|uniref:Uncharacterized protein n=1 Tax=Molorchus minor TaxID=1323400 RepID=A0ABQ9JEJ9_9CUCU|nr:hypothetical protein NQ317_009718 [Molorchus minor]